MGQRQHEETRDQSMPINEQIGASSNSEKNLGKSQKDRKRKRAEVNANGHVSATDCASASDEVYLHDSGTVTAQEKAAKKARKAERKARKAAERQLHESGANGKTAQPSLPLSQYSQHPKLTALSESKIEAYISSNFINVDDSRKQGFRPILDFACLPLKHEKLRRVFADFKNPTPIQSASWPYLLNGDDLIGIAETGSGKTLAFGLPCVDYVASIMSVGRTGRGAKAVIVSPTRELAMQSFEQLSKLSAAVHCKAVCIYGGMPKDEQRNGLLSAQIIVATPGRLNDFIQEGSADLSDVGYVVLDEADRMLDKGFEDEIRKIVSATRPSNRQTMMFTATWPQSVRELAATFMQSPVRISVGDNPVGDLRANTSITQQVEVMDPRAKDQRLVQLLKQYQSGKNKSDRILVFCLYKKEATRTENFIRSKGFKVAGIHGDLSQVQRTASLESFRDGNVPLLVATDVAARGLDIPAVKVVINVTFPLTVEDYVHRIGRTGRAGKSGLAITMFTENEKPLSGGLINVLKAAKQPVPEELLKFGTTVKKKAHDAYGAFYREPVEDVKATKITFD